MFWNEKHRQSKRQLDSIGRQLVRLGTERNKSAEEQAAAAPFLYAGIRARIAAAQQEPSFASSVLTVFPLLTVAQRAVPMMLATTIFAVLMFWFASSGGGPITAQIEGRPARMERIVLEGDDPSGDEVLENILVQNDYEEGER